MDKEQVLKDDHDPEDKLEFEDEHDPENEKTEEDEIHKQQETTFTVRFELPLQKINYGELLRIKPGWCINTRGHSPHEVLAFVGSRVIARCELVSLHDRRGARVIDLTND